MNSWIAPSALLSLAFLACACSPRLPEGVSRLDPELDHWQFKVDPPSGRLAYLRGGFPKKSFVVAKTLGKRGERAWRFEKRALYGPLHLEPGGRTAFVVAAVLDDKMRSSSQFPKERALLEVDLETGELKGDHLIPDKGTVRLVAGRSWPHGPFAVVDDGGLLELAPLSAPDLRGVAVPLPGAAEALADPELPLLTLSRKGRLEVYDVERGSAARVTLLESDPQLLAVAPDGEVLLYRQEKDGSSLLEVYDPRRGSRRELWRGEETPDQAVFSDRSVYMVTVTSATPLLRRLERRTGAVVWTGAWPHTPSRLLGVDADDKTIHFSVLDDDRSAFWSVKADPKTLGMLPALVDETRVGPGGSLKRAGYSLVALLGALVVVFGLLALFR